MVREYGISMAGDSYVPVQEHQWKAEGLLKGNGAVFSFVWAASGSVRLWCKIEAFRYQCRAVLVATSKSWLVQA